jgi:hypothetical protein
VGVDTGAPVVEDYPAGFCSDQVMQKLMEDGG